MTTDQIEVIRKSWTTVASNADAAAQLFYDRLFELDAALQPLFGGDMREQGRKLMAMIGTVVAQLDRLDSVVPAVRSLGRRHGGYGAVAKDYDTVGAALLWTLRQGLGDEFTSDTEAAWQVAYTLLADTMIAAAAGDGHE